MLWKFFERVPKTKNPNTQGGPGLSLLWWERRMLRFWLFGDYFAGRRSRERVLSMESPYRGTDSVNERTYSPWAWSVSTQIWFHIVWREPTHLHTSSLQIWKAYNGSQIEYFMGGPAFFHSPLRVIVKPSNYRSKDNNESPAFLCNCNILEQQYSCQ